MRLEEYLEEYGTPLTVFAAKTGASITTILNICAQRGDLLLSIALRIEEATKGQVQCKELLPIGYKDRLDRKRESQKNHPAKDKNKKKKNKVNKNNDSEL